MQSEKINISQVKSNPNNPRTMFVCKTCGNGFASKKACKSREPKFCSKPCYAESLKKAPKEKKPRVSRKGIPLSEEWKKALSEGRKRSVKCKGENLYNWKGGKATESVRMKEAFYRRKKNLTEKLNPAYLTRVLEAQGGKCFFCETDLSSYKAIEHLTPVSRGGDNQPYNTVYCCKSCNSSKRQNTLEEWAIKNKRFDWLDKFDRVYASAIY